MSAHCRARDLPASTLAISLRQGVDKKMTAVLAAVAIISVACILITINLIIAARSVRNSWYFSNVVILLFSSLLAVSVYDRLSFNERALQFADTFVSLQDQNVQLSEGLILKAVTKDGWHITYRYAVEGDRQIPTMRNAVEVNCRNAETRIILEYGFTIVHLFSRAESEFSRIELNREKCKYI